MGLSIQEYNALPGTRGWITEEGGLCKCDVVVFHRVTSLMSAVAQDAAEKEAKRNAKG